MKKIQLAATAVLFCFATATVSADPKQAGTHKGASTVTMLRAGIPSDLKMVSVSDLEKELKGKPAMAVGFDIDDTALFSSPVFYKGQQKYSPGAFSYLKKQTFWDEANCGWDAYSMPKETVGKIIAMHQKRGDKIFFITGRTAPTSKCGFVTKYLQKTFNITDMHDVIFAGSSKKEYTKAKYIKQNNIKMYYGDSDGDIISARQADAEGIRIMRAANSSYKAIPKNGIYGERIVADSQY